ncbi:MAG TPA: glycosyltransferase family 39 protein [Terriglobia bacterium]|nr:glycosyltransferase family 39 protein [Terriglobia bacterium]
MRDSRSIWSGDVAVLIYLAVGTVVVHLLTGGRYGFHRDELATLDDARHLAWGYVAYPPATPFFGRLSLVLFGTSLAGFRFFAALAEAAAVVLTGLMARELGGRRGAQMVAAVAAVPFCLAGGALMQYVSFDYLLWVLTAYFVLRLFRSGDPHWWIAIGGAIGLGMMTKYTMLFFVAGLAVGVLLTDARRYLKSRWLWYGAAAALVVFLPNLAWQARHGFVSLDFLSHIHARDIRIGRTAGFLPDQFWLTLFAFPLWLAGLYFYLFSSVRPRLAPPSSDPAGGNRPHEAVAIPGPAHVQAHAAGRFRVLGWMYIVPLLLFVIAKGRGYYLAGAYPMLYAAGSVWGEQRLARLDLRRRHWASVARVLAWAALAADIMIAAAVALPLTPVNSRWWKVANKINDDFREEIGWPELVETVAQIRDSLLAEDRARMGILAGNYGEAGAINLYGARYGLPPAISGINSFWQHGYGSPPPETMIVVGMSRHFVERNFTACDLAGHTWNRYAVENEETRDHPEIYVCRGLRQSWPEFWKNFQYYGAITRPAGRVVSTG